MAELPFNMEDYFKTIHVTNGTHHKLVLCPKINCESSKRPEEMPQEHTRFQKWFSICKAINVIYHVH